MKQQNTVRNTLCSPLFLLVLLLVPTLLGAQDTEPVTEAIKNSTNYFTALLGLITAVTALIVAVYTSRVVVKNKVEEAVKIKAKAYVDEFFSKELHIDHRTARFFFENYQQELDAYAKRRIFVIHHPDDEDQQTLVAQLIKAGFEQAKSRTTSDKLNIEAQDILLFDASQGLNNSAIDQYAANNSLTAKAQFFFFGPSRYEGKLRMINFANSQASIVNRIKEACLG